MISTAWRMERNCGETGWSSKYWLVIACGPADPKLDMIRGHLASAVFRNSLRGKPLNYAGSARVRAARGVLHRLSRLGTVHGHGCPDGRDGDFTHRGLSAAAANSAHALTECRAGVSVWVCDASAARRALHPVETDGIFLAGKPRVSRQPMDRQADTHATHAECCTW